MTEKQLRAKVAHMRNRERLGKPRRGDARALRRINLGKRHQPLRRAAQQ